MNETSKKQTIKEPTLINAAEMARQHPKTFWRPNETAIKALQTGNHVKVAIQGERFWVQLTLVDYPVLEGRIDNQCSGLRFGDTIRFNVDNVYEIL